MLCCCLPIHHRRCHGDLLASEQVERAIEVDLLASWVGAYHWRLALGRPDAADSCLKIQGCFILSQPDCMGRLLGDI